jgi:hypothetical protein
VNLRNGKLLIQQELTPIPAAKGRAESPATGSALSGSEGRKSLKNESIHTRERLEMSPVSCHNRGCDHSIA